MTEEAVRVERTGIPEDGHSGIVTQMTARGRKRKWLPKYLVLTIRVSREGVAKSLRILVDTGATINIIKAGLWPEHQLIKARYAKTLTDAQGKHLPGGSQGVVLTVDMPMLGVDGVERVKTLNGFFYEAHISCDAIISYDFLRKHKLGVFPHLDSLLHLGLGDDPVLLRQEKADQQHTVRGCSPEYNPVRPSPSGSGCGAIASTVQSGSGVGVGSPVCPPGTSVKKEGRGRVYSVKQKKNLNTPNQEYRKNDNYFKDLPDENSALDHFDRVDEDNLEVLDEVTREPSGSSRFTSGKDSTLSKSTRAKAVKGPKYRGKHHSTVDKCTLSALDTEIMQYQEKKEQVPVKGFSPYSGNPQVEEVYQVSGRSPLEVEKNSTGSRYQVAKKRPWVTESYAVIDEWRDKIVEWSGLDMTQAVDAFSSHKNRRFDRHWTKRQNAFLQDWSRDTLWINAPWSRLKEVVNKVVKDRAKGILIVPAWAKESWFKALRPITIKYWDLPHTGAMYQNDAGHVFEHQRHWPTRAIVFDATGVMSPDSDKFGSWYDRHEGLVYTVDEAPWVEYFEKSSLSSDSVYGVIETAEEDDTANQERDSLKNEFADVLEHKDVKVVDIPKEVRGPSGVARVELLPGATSKKERPFRMVGEREAALEELVQTFLARKWIAPCNSEWASRAFVVPKEAKGEWRMVVDYRYLNDCSKVDSYPLPIIEDVISKQSECRMWSVFDAEWGFHQMQLEEDSQELTAFVTPTGVYKWLVMPMGIKNGPSMFQRFISGVLSGIPNVHVYVDDIIIGSKGDTEEELLANHKRDVARVLQALREKKVYLKGAKSKMFVREVKFCGHILREGTRRAAPAKLAAVSKWEPEHITTVTQMKSFLGLAGWYEMYVPGYATRAAPLTDALTAKKSPSKKITWTESMLQSFHYIKTELLKNAPLQIVDASKPFNITVDASGWAVGGVLSQEDSQGQERPVAFFSRKLNGDFEKKTLQCGWSPREQETYALVVGLLKFQAWIGNNAVRIKCQTDHKSLEHWHQERLDMVSGPIGRRTRWHEFFSRFPNLEVVYLPGKDNHVADALSRWAYRACRDLSDRTIHGSVDDARFAEEQERKESLEEERISLVEDFDHLLDYIDPHEYPWTEDGDLPESSAAETETPERDSVHECINIKDSVMPVQDDSDSESQDEEHVNWRSWDTEYEEEDELKEIIQKLKDGHQVTGHHWNNKRLYHRGKIVVPVSLFLEVVIKIHEFHHSGRDKTIELFNRRYRVELSDFHVRKSIQDIIAACTVCGSSKPRNSKKPDRLVHHPVPPYIFSSMCMDFVDLPRVRYKKNYYDYLFVIVDRLSGYIQAIPCEKEGLTGAACADMFFRQVMMFTGLPKEVLTDQDIRLTSQFFNTLCALSGVEQHQSTVYRPRSNGRAEAAVKAVVNMLRKVLSQRKSDNWMDVLPVALWAINDSPGVVSHLSPHKIVFGRDCPAFGDEPALHTPRVSVTGEEWINYMKQLREDVQKDLTKVHEQEKAGFDRRHPGIKVFNPGDRVWLELLKDDRSKLDPKYMGPCEVLDRVHDDTYRVSTPDGEKQVVFDRLKEYPRLEGKREPLFYHRPHRAALPSGLDDVNIVEKIVSHRRLKNGQLQWRVRWKGCSPSEDTWEPVGHFLPQYNQDWARYCADNGLEFSASDLTPH